MQLNLNTTSRRDFLKLSSSLAMGVFLAPFLELGKISTQKMGRVIDESIKLYNRPSLSANELDTYWKDMLLTISEVTIGDLEPPHNRVWYQIDGKGYVHSGAVQPVQMILNVPTADIPTQGT